MASFDTQYFTIQGNSLALWYLNCYSLFLQITSKSFNHEKDEIFQKLKTTALEEEDPCCGQSTVLERKVTPRNETTTHAIVTNIRIHDPNSETKDGIGIAKPMATKPETDGLSDGGKIDLNVCEPASKKSKVMLSDVVNGWYIYIYIFERKIWVIL